MNRLVDNYFDQRSRKQRPKIDLAAFDTFEDTLMQAECLFTEMVMRVVVILTCLNLHFSTIYEFDLSGSMICDTHFVACLCTFS